MNFHSAKCFDDLVECNTNFIKGILKHTPGYCTPLEEESILILSELTELCQKYRILTIESQPAYVTETRRQRGYIVGAIQMENCSFVNQLNQLTDLEYTVRCGNKCYSKVTLSGFWWSFSENLVNGQWRSTTHLGTDSLTDISEHDMYETDDYNMLNDPSVTFFTICDPCFGCPTNHCCLELMKALESSP